ncbi:MAG TPA: penicillin-binding protein 2 [Nitrospiria bacterium]|jgi:penicillin-binding protein 2|nr:penicillin-binding protein 2 [Nitrospiria bacterium]
MDLDTSSDNPREIQNRLVYLMVGIVAIFAALLLRAWYLQITKGSYYKEQSENNRVRVVYIQPPRGLIFDRHGELLANNVPSFNLYLVSEDISDKKGVLDQLARFIQVDRSELERRITSRKNNVPYMPTKVKEGLSLREVALIESHRLDLAGTILVPEPQRNYLYGPLAAHLLGYVGEISPAQLQESGNEDTLPGTSVGQSGIEKTYDTQIRGEVGEKIIEVDAVGHEMKVLRVQEPASGDDVYLTIDLNVQKAAEEALGKNAGTIVAIDPRNGEILAMVSHPAFDPNQLSQSLSTADWEALSSDPGHPLTNRAIQGQYPPGSTFKLVVSSAALETKEVTPEEPILCTGGMPFGRRVYKDWKRGGHGIIDLHSAIVQSCDVYFYEMGRRLGIDRLADYAFRYGLGQPTGVELASEKSGVIPTSQWKLRAKGEPWYPGETLSAAIGQGFVTVTPIQLADLIGTVAMSGARFQPHLIKAIRDRATGRLYEFPPVELGRVDLAKKTYTALRQALSGVVSEPHGTGASARSQFVTIAGKTGTAQVVEEKAGVETKSLPKELQDHAWFIAFAPVEDPRIAVAVLVEHGGHGGETAAPPAKRVIEEYLKNDRPENHQQL